MLDTIERHFKDLPPAVDFCSLRFVAEQNEQIEVRQDLLQPVDTHDDVGVMITVVDGGGLGYAATSDLTLSGLRAALDHATHWAHQTAGQAVVDHGQITRPAPVGDYIAPVTQPWSQVSLSDRIDRAKGQCARLKTDDRIVDWSVSLWWIGSEQLYLTSDGGRTHQRFEYLIPGLSVTANEGGETVSRRYGGFDFGRQGCLEILDQVAFDEQAPQLSEEVVQLLAAPNCPTGTMDLLNITSDPTITDEFATYWWDDDGVAADRQFIIRDGILERGLGGITSQSRADHP
ncbi:MAG: metallopeptidase TldD-related protein [Candidatus Latescibacterota bacterium]|nr:metallopeptidase TldD-related protein [Candidatus Latescibacterota bacterium]